MNFENPFGPPTDPAYLRFSAGLDAYFDGEMGRYPWYRWCPKKQAWYNYAPPKLELVDALLGRTDFGTRFDPDDYPTFYRPAAYRAVSAYYQSIASKHPWAVWNPSDGSWRIARVSGTSPQPHTPAPPTDLERARARARLDRQRELEFAYQEYAAGRLDTEVYKRELDRIELKYKDLI